MYICLCLEKNDDNNFTGAFGRCTEPKNCFFFILTVKSVFEMVPKVLRAVGVAADSASE